MTTIDRGIYIVANDRVFDNTIALLNSIKAHSPNLRIALIPYSAEYEKLLEYTRGEYGVELHADLAAIDGVMSETYEAWCGPDSPPSQGIKLMNKFGCWFGQFDEFLYIDTDIVVFRDLEPYFEHFQTADFIHNDYQSNTGIEFVFKQPILDDGVIGAADVKRIFNAGFFGSKRSAMTRESLRDMLQDSAAHPQYFYPRYLDQCLLNYWVQRSKVSVLNIAKTPAEGAGSWAGSSRFEKRDGRLFDPNADRPVSYLHWAGFPIDPDAPYWEEWLYYRRLRDESYEFVAQPKPKRGLLDRLKAKVKRLADNG